MITGKAAPLSRHVSPSRRARLAARAVARSTPPPNDEARAAFRLMPAYVVGHNIVIDLVAGNQTTRMTLGREDAWEHAGGVVKALEELDAKMRAEVDATTETEDEKTADLEAMLAESKAKVSTLTEART
jgi:hypothetical protein